MLEGVSYTQIRLRTIARKCLERWVNARRKRQYVFLQMKIFRHKGLIPEREARRGARGNEFLPNSNLFFDFLEGIVRTMASGH